LRSPILTAGQLAQLLQSAPLRPAVVRTLFDPAGGGETMARRLAEIVDEACAAVVSGAALVVLSDAGVDAAHAPLPALLATSAVHQGLSARGLRLRASLAVETGDARDAHHVAALCAFGASAVCPALGYDTIAALAPNDDTGCGRAIARYRLALERGLL